MASKMAEISNTQEQYYLNYLQQKANNEREDTIRQVGYDREDAIRQEGYNREDNEKSFKDFLDGLSAFTTDEAKAKYAEGRIEEKDGKFYLDGRELTANEVIRYKNALANLDQSTSSNASVGINGSGVETGSDGNVYADGSKIQLGDDFEYEYHSSGLKYYDKDGHYKETWKSDYNQVMGTVFAGETTVLANLMKSASYNDGTIFRLKNSSGDCTYAVYKSGKLYYVKDGPSLWDKIGGDYGVEITDSKLERTGSKAKSYDN